MSDILTNQTFLKQWETGEIDNALLEQEVILIDEKILALQGAMQVVVAQKIEVTGGDDWHDGAFRATDGEANNIFEQVSGLQEALRLPRVALPEVTSTTATIGSRVALKQDGKFDYFVDLVGMKALHTYGDDDEVVVTSLQSPLGKALLGKEVGDEFRAAIGSRMQMLQILGVTPNPELKAE